MHSDVTNFSPVRRGRPFEFGGGEVPDFEELVLCPGRQQSPLTVNGAAVYRRVVATDFRFETPAATVHTTWHTTGMRKKGGGGVEDAAAPAGQAHFAMSNMDLASSMSSSEEDPTGRPPLNRFFRPRRVFLR